MLDPIQQPYVMEPGEAVQWCYDRNTRLYVRFERYWIPHLDANGEQIDTIPAYRRNPDEIYLDPEQLTHLIAWMEDERAAWVEQMIT